MIGPTIPIGLLRVSTDSMIASAVNPSSGSNAVAHAANTNPAAGPEGIRLPERPSSG
jgi:hypothetical protein